MPKQQQRTPDSNQLKGADGTFETITVKGVRVNKHEHDEETDGPADKESSGGSGSRKSKKESEDYDSMTKDEIQQELDKQGIEYKSDETKDELIKHLKKGK
jgi:hypothetical protein